MPERKRLIDCLDALSDRDSIESTARMLDRLHPWPLRVPQSTTPSQWHPERYKATSVPIRFVAAGSPLSRDAGLWFPAGGDP